MTSRSTTRARSRPGDGAGGYRGLAQQWPDAYEEKLALTLANIAGSTCGHRSHDEALEHASEAVALLRRLDAQVAGSLPLPAVRGARLALVLALGLRARGRGAARERGGGRAAA